MDVATLAQKLTTFESTHENKEQLDACLDFCRDYFSVYDQMFVKEFESNGCRSVVITTHDTLTPDVMLLGHIDTVPGKAELFKGTVVDDKLYGRGTLDMKAFVATSMKVLENVLEARPAASVAVAIVTDEELGGVHGTRYLTEDIGYRPRVVLVPDDGEDLHVIVSETKRIFQVDFTAKGVESHANRPWDGENAILKLLRTYDRLQKTLNVPDERPEDSFIDTCNLGLISGGVASNEVPEHATMTVDIRLVDQTRSDLERILETIVIPGVNYQITLEGLPTKLDTSSPLVQLYEQTLQDYINKPIEYKRAGGATDARYFAAVGSIPIVHQSHGRNAQAADEYILLSELETLVQMQTQYILKLDELLAGNAR